MSAIVLTVIGGSFRTLVRDGFFVSTLQVTKLQGKIVRRQKPKITDPFVYCNNVYSLSRFSFIKFPKLINRTTPYIVELNDIVYSRLNLRLFQCGVLSVL